METVMTLRHPTPVTPRRSDDTEEQEVPEPRERKSFSISYATIGGILGLIALATIMLGPIKQFTELNTNVTNLATAVQTLNNNVTQLRDASVSVRLDQAIMAKDIQDLKERLAKMEARAR